jgi:NADPH:quinone reductase-like Zn-dependent oxidoreductase
LLVHGAGGVTGGLVVRFAALAGARVIATAGPGSADRVRGLGAGQVIDYHDPSWPALAREAAGGAVDAAVNAVPGGSGDALAAVADSGRLVTIAGAAPSVERGVAVQAVFVQADRDLLTRPAALLASGELILAIAGEFPLDHAADALTRLQAGTDGAAVVLTL